MFSKTKEPPTPERQTRDESRLYWPKYDFSASAERRFRRAKSLYVFVEMLSSPTILVGRLKLVNFILPQNDSISSILKTELGNAIELFIKSKTIDFRPILSLLKIPESSLFFGATLGQNRSPFRQMDENFSDIILVIDGKEKKAHRLILCNSSDLCARLLASNSNIGAICVDLNKFASRKELENLLNDKSRLASKISKIILPSFIGSEVFEEIWAFIYGRGISSKAFANPKTFAELNRAVLFLGMSKLQEELWSGFFSLNSEKSSWNLSEPIFLELLNNLILVNEMKIETGLLCAIAYLVALRILSEGSSAEAGQKSPGLKLSPLFAEDLIFISSRANNVGINSEILKSLVNNSGQNSVEYLISRFKGINSFANFSVCPLNLLEHITAFYKQPWTKEEFKERDFIEISNEQQNLIIDEKSGETKRISFSFGFEKIPTASFSSQEHDFQIRLSINAIKKGSRVFLKPFELPDFALTFVFEFDESKGIELFFFPTKLTRQFKVFVLSLKVTYESHTQSQSQLIVLSNSEFCHLVKELARPADEASELLKIELGFREDVIAGGLLANFAASFQQCPLEESELKASDFPPALSQIMCLPLPLLFSLLSSDDLVVSSEDQVLLIVSRFIHALEEKTARNEDEPLIFDLFQLNQKKAGGLFESIYCGKLPIEKEEIGNLLFAAVRLLFVSTSFALSVLGEEPLVGCSQFRREALANRLKGKALVSEPRASYARRKLDISEVQNKVFGEIIDWIVEQNQHDSCRKALQQNKRNLEMIKTELQKAEGRLRRKEEELEQYRSKKKEEILIFERRVKREESQIREDRERGFFSSICVIF